MLEDFMDKGGINDVDDKTFSQEIADLVGTYASPDGDVDMITISVKVNRDLHNRYDVLRRLYKRTRKEDLERFMRWSIERYKSEAKGLETFFTKDKDIR
jgi:hypothetical protein